MYTAQMEAKTGIKLGNEGEIAAYVAYARSYPSNFLALVDSYDTLRSGVPNYLATALVSCADCGRAAARVCLPSSLPSLSPAAFPLDILCLPACPCVRSGGYMPLCSRRTPRLRLVGRRPTPVAATGGRRCTSSATSRSVRGPGLADLCSSP
eukprot:SAG22_NODE_957_length_6316_cov_2.176130_4_plen_152_part_00